MIYEGVGFNDNWAVSITEDEFCNAPENLSLWKDVPIETVIERLREAHKLILLYAHSRKFFASSVKSRRKRRN